jgi:hypothetical protein
MNKKELTEEEQREFDALMVRAWSGEGLTRDEKIRANILSGHDPEWAEWIADHGFPRE